ncbi:hypothetical protein [Rhodanobacter sp. OR87]|nr:hypothetical protein [Rhodanobacter sp. OR87]
MRRFSMMENDSLIDLENAVIWVVGVAVVLRCQQLSTATAWRYYLLVFLG